MITYPASLDTHLKKLEAIYSLRERMRLSHNALGDEARAVLTANAPPADDRQVNGDSGKYASWLKSDKAKTYFDMKGKWYLYSLRPERLGGNIFDHKHEVLLREQNRLRELIRKEHFTDEQWRALNVANIHSDVHLSLFGNRQALKVLPTSAACTEADELEAITLSNIRPMKVPDPYEDFTSYTEGDPDSNITIVSSSEIDVDSMHRDADAQVYKDRGANHFADFEHLTTIEWTAAGDSGDAGSWSLSDGYFTIGSMYSYLNGFITATYCASSSIFRFVLKEFPTNNTDYHVQDTCYQKWYNTIKRDGTALSCKMYEDAARTTLHDTLAVTCGTESYRYIAAVVSRAGGDGEVSISFKVFNFDLQEGGITPGIQAIPLGFIQGR